MTYQMMTAARRTKTQAMPASLKVCICTQLLTASANEPPPNALLVPRTTTNPFFYVPITTASSPVKSYGGISKFNGAGPFLARPEIS